MEELVLKVHILNEIERSFRNSLSQSQGESNPLEQVANYLIEWVKIKKQIRLLLLDRSTLPIYGSGNKEIRTIIQKISLGEKLPFEACFSGTGLEKIFETELEDIEIEDLQNDLFYSWFSGYEFVRELYKVGALVLSIGILPTNLSMFVDELRFCYVFQRGLAVYSICRAILDIATLDIFNNNDLNNGSSD